jgi:hypothetical protein
MRQRTAHARTRAATSVTAFVTVTVLALRERAARLGRDPDAGLTTAEYLMWIAIIAAIIGLLGVTVSTLYTNKANGLSLN